MSKSADKCFHIISHTYMELNLVFTFTQEAKSGAFALQQGVCRMLGVLDYNAHPGALNTALDFLLASVDRSVRVDVHFVLHCAQVMHRLPLVLKMLKPEEMRTTPCRGFSIIFCPVYMIVSLRMIPRRKLTCDFLSTPSQDCAHDIRLVVGRA